MILHERREVLASLGAVAVGAFLPQAPSLPPPQAPSVSDLTITLRTVDGEILATRQLPYAHDLTTWWPRWLLPKADTLWVDDGVYDCGWPVSVLKRSEGRWMFSCWCRWLMWPREA